ncbi:MAG: SDR family oxidoreductase [Acidimicrobiia bacterium]
MRILVTGATGYIGGRLVPRLLDEGFDVRCMSRDPELLSLDPWRDRVEVVAADAMDPESLDEALKGCDAAYYLIHAMEGSRDSFAVLDRAAAKNFSRAAERQGLQRIVYLGALGSDSEPLSEHLDSRHEVGRVLASGSTPITELRAAVIIGSGSMSFEMIRHLTEVLPVMMRPDWVKSRCQPIAVRNVLEILVAVIDDRGTEDRVYDIGGPDVLSYEDLMQGYAQVAHLRRRLVIPFPIFSERLSPMFVGLATPLPVDMARPLIESLQHDVVVHGASPPGFEPGKLIPYEEAVNRALARIRESAVDTRWSDALSSPASPMPSDPVWAGATMLSDRRAVQSTASPQDLFWAVSRIGGEVGYYTMNWTWIVRGWFDSLIGGVGLRRGRRDPEEIRPGEALDFFRVAEVDPEEGTLVLRAEMKVPGTAWLGWSIEPTDDGSRLTQSALFAPRGLPGRLYWYVLLPIHAAIWERMAHKIAAAAEHRGHARGT